jgi:predicted dehydrogenase
MAIKVGIVGAKFAANFHFESYQQIGKPAVEVAGVYSKNPESRNAFAKKHNVKAFETFEDMALEVDVVDVCVPGYMHEYFCVRASELGKHSIVEKPFTGAYGNGSPDWRGDKADKKELLKTAIASTRRMVQASKKNKTRIMYAENWVYAPAIQKEAEIIRATKGQVLWMHGEESHSGSISTAYGDWSLSGGGSLVGKGCHPLTAMLYFKKIEGERRIGRAIRPKFVNCRTHQITRLPEFVDAGYLRKDYKDVEDFVQVHITFEDGMVADVFSCEIVMGGVHNWLEVYCNNHRMRCNINPIDACTLYNPDDKQLKDVYIVEKIGTKQGWSFPAPDENWATGYPQELQDFMECVDSGKEPQSGLQLAADTVATLYAAYLSDQQNGATVEITLLDT